MRVYRNADTGAREEPAPGLTGAATLSFPVTGHAYYGSARDLRKWFHRQLSTLVGGNHPARRLQELFATAAPMEFVYAATEDLAAAREIVRTHCLALRGSRLLLNERIPQLHSPAVRAKAKETFKTEAYKAKAGKSRQALWADPEYRNQLLIKRASPESRAKRAAYWRRVSIDGVVYAGLTAASRATGLSRVTIDRRCNNLEYPNYQYLPPLSGSDSEPLI